MKKYIEPKITKISINQKYIDEEMAYGTFTLCVLLKHKKITKSLKVAVNFNLITDEIYETSYGSYVYKNNKIVYDDDYSDICYEKNRYFIKYSLTKWMDENRDLFIKQKIMLINNIIKDSKNTYGNAQRYINSLAKADSKYDTINKQYSHELVELLYGLDKSIVKIKKYLDTLK